MTTEFKDLFKITKKEWSKMHYTIANDLLKPLDPEKRLEVLQNAPKNMLPYEGWIKKSKQDILQRYMNARVTAAQCLGHTKANMNAGRITYYHNYILEYNIPMPSDKVIYLLGDFNGKGSV